MVSAGGVEEALDVFEFLVELLDLSQELANHAFQVFVHVALDPPEHLLNLRVLLLQKLQSAFGLCSSLLLVLEFLKDSLFLLDLAVDTLDVPLDLLVRLPRLVLFIHQVVDGLVGGNCGLSVVLVAVRVLQRVVRRLVDGRHRRLPPVVAVLVDLGSGDPLDAGVLDHAALPLRGGLGVVRFAGVHQHSLGLAVSSRMSVVVLLGRVVVQDSRE